MKRHRDDCRASTEIRITHPHYSKEIAPSKERVNNWLTADKGGKSGSLHTHMTEKDLIKASAFGSSRSQDADAFPAARPRVR